jgi:hypothetical protein
VALTGARFEAELDGTPLEGWWRSFPVKAGQELRIGAVDPDGGVRGYLAVAGGVDVPRFLGSRATFPSGGFGGYQGRYLRPGDSLPIGQHAAKAHATTLPEVRSLPERSQGGAGMTGLRQALPVDRPLWPHPTPVNHPLLPQGWRTKYAGAIHAPSEPGERKLRQCARRPGLTWDPPTCLLLARQHTANLALPQNPSTPTPSPLTKTRLQRHHRRRAARPARQP